MSTKVNTTSGCYDRKVCPSFRNDDIDCLAGAVNACYEATYGPIDMATATHGDYHFNADGSGKLERWNSATKCLELVRVFDGNKVKYEQDGLVKVMERQGGEWVEPAPSPLDPAAVAAALTGDPVALATLCDALAPLLISTDAGNSIRAGTDGKLFENDAVAP